MSSGVAFTIWAEDFGFLRRERLHLATLEAHVNRGGAFLQDV